MTATEAATQPNGKQLADLITLLDDVANEQSVARSSVALAWILAHPAGIIPIIGTQRVERIQQSIEALTVKLDRATWNNILVAAQGEPLP
jgi:predicted oxidoreductase